MSPLSARKELLMAQSALYRARLGIEVAQLRERASRGSGWIATFFTLVSLVRTVRSIVTLFGRSGG
jgi:hypothetical protein